MFYNNFTKVSEHDSTNNVGLVYVSVFFETSTYDEIERDKKVTLEGQLGLIGGTMGLLTGFSILSGVEILYYLARLFLSLWRKRICCRKGKESCEAEATNNDLPFFQH